MFLLLKPRPLWYFFLKLWKLTQLGSHLGKNSEREAGHPPHSHSAGAGGSHWQRQVTPSGADNVMSSRRNGKLLDPEARQVNKKGPAFENT